MTALPAPLQAEPTILLTDLFDRVRRNQDAFGMRFPTIGDDTLAYQLSDNANWLCGFWPGMLWLVYAATQDNSVREHAERLLETFRTRLDNKVHITHDLGFLFTLSARAQWQLTGDAAARDLALRAAQILVKRFHPAGKYIQAWGDVGDTTEGGRTIIDTLMNVPLLFWAGEQTGETDYHVAAREHVDTTAKYLVRADGGSFHTFFFDQETGEPIGPRTHQGYADESLWARGQGWTIFGFAAAAAWTGTADHLDIACRAAERFMAELPQDGVPLWDLRLPDDAPQYPDTSAGAIAAAGMLRAAQLLEGEPRQRMRDLAITLLQALVDHQLETRPEAQGLLNGGTFHAHKKLGVDTYFICGDYFFLEALLMLDGCAPDFWGPSTCA